MWYLSQFIVRARNGGAFKRYPKRQVVFRHNVDIAVISEVRMIRLLCFGMVLSFDQKTRRKNKTGYASGSRIRPPRSDRRRLHESPHARARIHRGPHAEVCAQLKSDVSAPAPLGGSPSLPSQRERRLPSAGRLAGYARARMRTSRAVVIASRRTAYVNSSTQSGTNAGSVRSPRCAVTGVCLRAADAAIAPNENVASPLLVDSPGMHARECAHLAR